MKFLLQRLVGLFPPAFRSQFGNAMEEQIEQDYDRACQRGFAAAASFTLGTAWDLARSAVAEHVTPTWTSAQPRVAAEASMRFVMEEWARDIKLAARALMRAPGFAAVSIGTLGLAIGVTAGMFSVVNTVLLHPLPYADADRLVNIAATAPGSGLPAEFGVSIEFFLQYKEQSKLLEDISTYNIFTSTFRAGDRVERIWMSWPTNSLFTTLGAKPMLGRLPVAADEDHAIILSYALWTTWFSGDSSIVGRSYYVGDRMRTVIGVMGPSFKFPNEDTMLWISSEIRPEGLVPGRFGTSVVGRMRPGVTPEALERELTSLSKRLPERFGGTPNYAMFACAKRFDDE